MGLEQYSQEIKGLYHTYYNEFKFWLAAVETRYQELPAEILNELRAFTDHISRCYLNGISNKKIKENLERAENHLNRACFDCVKTLVISYFDEINNFEDTTKNFDLSLVQNGEFYVEYRHLKQAAEEKFRLAKKTEKDDRIIDYKDVSFENFQNAFNKYNSLVELINKNLVHIDWAKRKKTTKKILVSCAVIIYTTIIAPIIGPQIVGFIKKLLELIRSIAPTSFP